MTCHMTSDTAHLSFFKNRLKTEITPAHLQGHSLCLEYVSVIRSMCVCLGLSQGMWKARGQFRTPLSARNRVVLRAAWGLELSC